jgi:hypothetical protein
MSSKDDDFLETNGVRWFQFIIEVVSKLGLTVAVLYGILEYMSAVDNRQRDMSFSLIESWEKEGFREDYLAVTAYINEEVAKIPADFATSPRQNMLETSFVGGKLLARISVDRQFEEHVQNLYYFYSKVGVCAGEEICDAKLLAAFFRSGAQDFLSYLNPYMLRLRTQGQKEFGSYAEAFFLG